MIRNRAIVSHQTWELHEVTFHEKILIQSQKQSQSTFIFCWSNYLFVKLGAFFLCLRFHCKVSSSKVSPLFSKLQNRVPIEETLLWSLRLDVSNVSVLENPNKHVMIDRAFSSINAVAAVVEAFYRVVKPFIKGSVSQILGIKHSTAKSSFSFRM